MLGRMWEPLHHSTRRGHHLYTGYMELMIELIETKPSSFEEEVAQPIWVDAMVEEY